MDSLKFRELAWLRTCRELFAQLPQDQREGLIRNLPLDCEALRQIGVEVEDAILLKIVEVKAFEIEVNEKGLDLTDGSKTSLYSKPFLWGSLVQHLAQIQEN